MTSVEQTALVLDQQFDELTFVLDSRQSAERVALGAAQERGREDDGQVLRTHHVLAASLSYSATCMYRVTLNVRGHAECTRTC